VERIEAWERLGALSQAAMRKASEVIDSLQQRRYLGRYRHPALVRFRQLMLLLLPIVLILAPLLSITLETSVVLTPQIRFRPLPLLNPEQKVVLELSPELTAAHVAFVVIPNSLLLLAAALILVFFIFSFFLGLVVVAFTPLRSIQARGQCATVYLDDHGIAAGQGAQATRLLWQDVSQFVRADVCFWRRPLQDSSNFGLVATQEPLIVGADTTRYATVRRRASGFVPSEADVINLDYTILRSKLGLLYVLSLLLVGLVGILAAFAKPSLILRDLPGTYYSLADLYPYLLFFLVLAPLWWAVVQPLRQRMYLHPSSRFPLWILGLGLLLALVQVILRFRPLLTVVNLYPPLITIIVLVSSAVVVWRARAAGKKVYPLFLRLGTAVVVVVVCLLMATVLWRGMQAYHYLVRGNSIRDRALENQDAILSAAWMDRAIRAYEKAVKAGGGEIWGIDPKPGAGIGIGIPVPHNLTWLSALTSQGALQTQRDQNAAAVQSFSEAFKYTERKDEIFVGRALAQQRLATESATPGGPTVDQTRYREAVRDLNEAITLNPNDASLYLWRGLAQHALGQGEAALDDYQKALQLDTSGDGPLTPDQQVRTERALTGQGWIMYALKDYEGARDLFQQAREAGPDTSEAWLAEGYALYTLERFEGAEEVWEEAARLDPKDPTVLISLGTLHWKFGGETGRELERDRCQEYGRSIDYLNRALDRDRLWPQLDKDVAFTYRTRGYVQWLLASCPEYDKVTTYKDAYASFSEAIKLDVANAHYWYRRGRVAYGIGWLLRNRADAEANKWLLQAVDDVSRAVELAPDVALYWYDLGWLSYGVWSWGAAVGFEANEWLFRALAAMEQARVLRPEDTDDYTPSQWIKRIQAQAVDGGVEQGDERFASGRFAEALAHYELVVKKVPENLKAMFKTGLALLALGETEEALAQYETGLEQALAQGKTLDAQEALLELNTWAIELDLDAEAVLALFQEHGSALEVKDARTAFALGLATLKLGDQERALSWYRDGIELARAEGRLSAAEEALGELYLAFLESEALDVDRVLSAFRAARIELVPDDAQDAFSLALATLIKGERRQSVQLYSQAVEYAAADGDLGTVRAAAQTLREFLLGHPDMDPADAYWPLQDDPLAREGAVAELERPDLYWYYRADFGFRLLNNRELFKRRLGEEKVYEEIYAGIIADVERAYALNPEEHQRMRDFFVDANIGWLFLRRGDDLFKEGDLENALVDYQEAARRIQPASNDAAGDLTEATFKAGLSALMLEDVEQATTWYEKAIQLADEYGSVFDLSTRVDDAVKALQALEEDRDLAPVIEPMLDELEQLQ
jgi:tetratricopeptide (TPR) repeat protein